MVYNNPLQETVPALKTKKGTEIPYGKEIKK
jgi:hypothetical protein